MNSITKEQIYLACMVIGFLIGCHAARDHYRSKIMDIGSEAIKDCNAESQKWFDLYMLERFKNVTENKSVKTLHAFDASDSTITISRETKHK